MVVVLNQQACLGKVMLVCCEQWTAQSPGTPVTDACHHFLNYIVALAVPHLPYGVDGLLTPLGCVLLRRRCAPGSYGQVVRVQSGTVG